MSSFPQPFALEFSSQGAPTSLIEALAGHVLQHVGCTTAPVSELTAAIEKAAAAGGFGGGARCDVQFRAQRDTLDILVSANGGRVWQTRCTIP
ncbi:MAG: hypothetical protein QM736_18585 [Vicinamibacterales bacterium]